MAAVVQLRDDTPGKSRHAMRCLRRRISDTVYRQLVADATRSYWRQAGASTPGRHSHPARPI